MPQKVDEEYKSVLRLTSTIRMLPMTVIPLGMLIVLYSVTGLTTVSWVFLGILFALAAVSIFMIIWYPSMWYDNYSFDLEENGVKINSGVITKSEKFIPYDKIQDLTIQSGYWERRYGLSTILLETAGAAGGYQGRYYRPEGIIPGLRDPQPIADEIRAKMSK